MKRFTGLVCALLLVGQAARAQGVWLPAGDHRLRSDVTLLADEGVIQVPVTAWPMPLDDLARALQRVDLESIGEPGLRAALSRVRSIAAAAAIREAGVRDLTATGGRPGLLRGYEEAGREEGELRLRSAASTGPWSLDLALAVVASPADGKRLRFDGSDLTLRAGNWLLSANSFDRWWGPGYYGSLILSNNARPMIGLSLDRVHTTPFPIPLLRWLGPWRFSAYAATMEGRRPDVDLPVYMALRATFKPLPILEGGFSRSMQFCGRGRPCDLQTLGRVLLGRDNQGIRVAPEDEPGNQMAGFDARLVSPFRRLPLALYAQLIGEDSSSTTIPEKYLALFGLEGWMMLDGGSVLRARLEYSDTTCSYGRAQPYIDCAYDQGIFFAGYRFRGRVVGHATDSDSEMVAAGVGWTLARGDELRLDVRRAHLDRYGAPDPSHSVVFGFHRYQSLELAWRTRVLGDEVSLKVGAERSEPDGGTARNRAYGFLSWQRRL